MRHMSHDQDGYILVLGLVLMPIFLGFALLIIDVGRGNNAQSDLSAAADAVALAGGRELDGRIGAIARANVAMAQLENTVSMLSPDASDPPISLVYADEGGNEFTVVFLKDIPVSDDTPIDAAWVSNNNATDGRDAKYIYVRVQSRNLGTTFLNPANLLRSSVSVAAMAVAKSQTATCNLAPLYMCNPFEGGPPNNLGTDPFLQNFRDGNLHGRILKLRSKASGLSSPGNFGFLQTYDDAGNLASGANALRHNFASDQVPKCSISDTVTTKPGGTGGASNGYNVRFDIYEGSLNSSDYSTALNVRKGYHLNSGGGNSGGGNSGGGNSGGGGNDFCKKAEISEDVVMGFEDNFTMVSIPGADIGEGDWPIMSYFQKTYEVHGLTATRNPENGEIKLNEKLVTSSFPNNPIGFGGATGPGAAMPSRYDVYLHELKEGLYQEPLYELPTASGPYRDENLPPPAEPVQFNGESGKAQCGSPNINPAIDRRIMTLAIVDCVAQSAEGGGVNKYKPNLYANIFMVRPWGKGGDGTIDVEIIDVSGWAGNGSLEVREEAVLVR